MTDDIDKQQRRDDYVLLVLILIALAGVTIIAVIGRWFP
jgi:hypothetical protein